MRLFNLFKLSKHLPASRQTPSTTPALSRKHQTSIAGNLPDLIVWQIFKVLTGCESKKLAKLKQGLPMLRVCYFWRDLLVLKAYEEVVIENNLIPSKPDMCVSNTELFRNPIYGKLVRNLTMDLNLEATEFYIGDLLHTVTMGKEKRSDKVAIKSSLWQTFALGYKFIRFFGFFPNMVSANISIEKDQFDNELADFTTVLVVSMPKKMEKIQVNVEFPLANSFPSNLKCLEFSCSYWYPLVPKLNPLPLEHLKMTSIQAYFCWQAAFGNSKSNTVKFPELKTLYIDGDKDSITGERSLRERQIFEQLQERHQKNLPVPVSLKFPVLESLVVKKDSDCKWEFSPVDIPSRLNRLECKITEREFRNLAGLNIQHVENLELDIFTKQQQHDGLASIVDQFVQRVTRGQPTSRVNYIIE